jgi:glycosyltransferase involved in cell wall biosynthesis
MERWYEMMAKQKKLSLCIMTKNEKSYFPDCLASMEGAADEIIVADLGSHSRTPELAKQAGATVYQPVWEDDFSKIKNFCMDRAAGDWVLFLQADETIHRDQFSELKLMMQNPAAEGYLIDVDDCREKRAEACPTQSLRLLRNRNNYRYKYRSFEYIPDEEMYCVLCGNIRIIRSTETASEWQMEERIRLLQADLKERPQDGYVRYLQGIELLNQEKYKESAASFELARHALGGGYLYAPHLYKCLGVCWLALSQHEAAEEVLSEGLWLFPFFTDLHVLRADLYRRLGRDAEALKDLEIGLMLRNSPNTCVPQPNTNISSIIKMRERIRMNLEGGPVKV